MIEFECFENVIIYNIKIYNIKVFGNGWSRWIGGLLWL